MNQFTRVERAIEQNTLECHVNGVRIRRCESRLVKDKRQSRYYPDKIEMIFFYSVFNIHFFFHPFIIILFSLLFH